MQLAQTREAIGLPAFRLGATISTANVVKLLMQRLNCLHCGMRAARDRFSSFKPCAQTAQAGIERRRNRALALQACLQVLPAKRDAPRRHTAPADCSALNWRYFGPARIRTPCSRPRSAVLRQAWGGRCRNPAQDRTPFAAASGRVRRSQLPRRSRLGERQQPVPDTPSRIVRFSGSSSMSRTKLWSIFKILAGRRLR